MLPQARLVARLKAIAAVTAIVKDEIRAEIVPGLEHYPALVLSVLSNVPANSGDDGSNEYTMKLRLAALGLGAGVPAPYDVVWQLAMAVVGDAEQTDEEGRPTPTGVSGWTDADGNLWHLDDMLDESGQIESGTDTFYAFVVNIFLSVQWRYVPNP